MAEKTAELYADFSLNFAKGDFDAAATSIGSIVSEAMGGVGVFGQFARGLLDIGMAAVKTATHFHELGQVYGLNTQNLQRMEIAGLQANVSMDKIEQSAVGLQNQLAELSLGHVNRDFLESAARLGVAVAPGMDQQQVMDQLFKKVPDFVKSHGKMGRAMATALLGRMSIAPEMMQQIMGGKEFGKGPTMKDKNIESMTRVSENLHVLSRNIQYLSYNAIAPLVKALIPITNWLMNKAGGVANLKDLKEHPLQSLGKIGSWITSVASEKMNYVTKDQARKLAQERLGGSAHAGIGATLLSMSARGVARAASAASGAVSHNNETHISIHGVEDHKIAKAVQHAVRGVHEKQKRDFAMQSALSNPAGQ
jgi:hypothetical protein